MSDALGDLARGALRWATGEADEVVVQFHAEPAVSTLVLRRVTGGAQVAVETAASPRCPTETILEARVDEHDLIEEIVRACSDIDAAAYAQSWPQHHLPHPELDELRLWVRANPSA